jgi:glycosyltransferase involved in cell wall biosynthesis
MHPLTEGQTLTELVSVVIPVYNGARFVAEAIASIRAQGHEPLEIIVVDDGSTDGSLELARTLPDVRVIEQNHGGPAAARNAGVNKSRGVYLGFLDADDLWAKDKLASQLSMFKNCPDAQLMAGLVEEFYDQGAGPIAEREARRSGERAYTIGALLMRRSDFLAVGLLNENLSFGEFIDWRSRALNLGMKERVLDQVVLKRRIHQQNTTKTSGDFKAGYVAAIRAHLQRKRAGEISPENSGS